MTRDSVTPATTANVKIAVAAAMQSATNGRARPPFSNRAGETDTSTGIVSAEVYAPRRHMSKQLVNGTVLFGIGREPIFAWEAKVWAAVDRSRAIGYDGCACQRGCLVVWGATCREHSTR